MTLWLWLCAVALGAVQVQLRAEPPALMVGQTGTVKMLIVSTGRGDPALASRRPPALPAGPGLLAEYAGQAQQFHSVNGRISRVQSFEYRVTALEPGTWTVGPLSVALDDGSTVRSEEVQIAVRERAEGEGPDAEFTVDVGFDDTTLWEGQVAVFHARFESRVPGAHISWREPTFDGLRPPQHGNVDETRYVVDDPGGAITVEQQLRPLVAVGTGTRDQGVVSGEVALPVGVPDLFGLSRRRIEQVVSERLSVTIERLPPPPPDFSGLVGEFQVRSELDAGADPKGARPPGAPTPREVAVGQSVPWLLVVTGSGALEGFELPPYGASGASVYENDHQVTGRIDGDGYVGTAAFRRVIVPTREGELKLPDTKLVTFSPATGKYVTHTVPMPTLKVVPGSESASALEVYGERVDPAAAEDAVPAVELRPPYESGRATAPSLAPVLPPLLGLAAMPGLVVLGFSGVRALVERRRARRRAHAAPESASAVLRRLPQEPQQRLAALDLALRRVEARGAPADRVRALRMRLGKVRFGGGEPDLRLERDLRDLVEEIES